MPVRPAVSRRPTRQPRLLVAVVALLLVVAAGVTVLIISLIARSPTEPPSTSTSIKPPVQGLTLESVRPLSDADAGVYGGMVSQVSWASLQPHANGALDTESIDRALTIVRTFNSAHPSTPIHLKLRVLAGIHAPDWVKSLGGFRPVTVANLQGGQSGTIGPFWTRRYESAYAALQRRLASRYDGDVDVRDVAISGCMTVFAEPFQRDDTNFADLYAQGYTVSADERCLRTQIDAHDVWLHTRQSLALNPYRPWVQRNGRTVQTASDARQTVTVMKRCRSLLGPRCVLANNSVRADYTSILRGNAESLGSAQLGQYADLYSAMRSLGPPLGFQTAGPSRVGDLQATVAAAARLGANYVEIPVSFDRAAMRKATETLKANPANH